MKKWICVICGYIYSGFTQPKECPVCKASELKFNELFENHSLSNEYSLGVAKNVNDEMTQDLRESFTSECEEIGTYLAMSKVAYRQGYREIGDIYRKIAFEEAEHASRFAELLGDVVVESTKDNLEKILEEEYDATQNKLKIAKRAKELGMEVVHDTVYEMCKDEARHGKSFAYLINRYFNNNKN